MEGGESVLDTLFDEESFEDAQDIEMLDVEEGEFIEEMPKAESGERSDVGVKQVNQESNQRDSGQKRKKKRKSKRKRNSSSGPNVTNVNRFVLDACKRLKERKSYLMWTAVGCLGISALSDLVKEVDAIQACGGQKTSDGRRFRNGGGILWNIIKTREPNAYKEIMNKGKEFEKQFKKQLHGEQEFVQQKDDSSRGVPLKTDQINRDLSDGLQLAFQGENQLEQSSAGQKRVSVRDRIRVPVTYDDVLGGEDSKNDPE